MIDLTLPVLPVPLVMYAAGVIGCLIASDYLCLVRPDLLGDRRGRPVILALFSLAWPLSLPIALAWQAARMRSGDDS